jgi:hypothetical protein
MASIALAIGGSALVSAGAGIYSARQSAKGAQQAASAQIAATQEMTAKIEGAAKTANKQLKKEAEHLEGAIFAQTGAFEKKATKIANTVTYTPVGDFLTPGADGKSAFDRVSEVYLREDGERRRRVLGEEAEANLRSSMEQMSRLAAGDTSGFKGLVRSMAAAAAANTKAGPIGAFANLSARNQFELMQTGAESSSRLGAFFSGFETETPTVVQSSMALRDELLREAVRKDERAARVAQLKIGVLETGFGSRVSAIGQASQIRTNAATALASSLSGAAINGNTGAGTAGIAAAGNASIASSIGTAVNQGIGNYMALNAQRENSSLMKAYLAKASGTPATAAAATPTAVVQQPVAVTK